MSALATLIGYAWLGVCAGVLLMLAVAAIAPLFGCRHTRDCLGISSLIGLHWFCPDCKRIELLGKACVRTPRRRVKAA